MAIAEGKENKKVEAKAVKKYGVKEEEEMESSPVEEKKVAMKVLKKKAK